MGHSHRRLTQSVVAFLVAAAGAAPAPAQSFTHVQTKEAGIASGVWVGNTLYLSGQLPSPVTPADRAKGTPAVYANTQAQAENALRARLAYQGRRMALSNAARD